MDAITQKRIEQLHPKVREEMTKIISACNTALTGRAQVRITQGLRTFDEQNDLFAKGRTAPGPKVTNAKGGQSVHNYGFAVDLCLLIDQKEVSWDITKDWDKDSKADWIECVTIFNQFGWDWGGNWKTMKDFPHFEKRGYNDWKKLYKLKKNKGYVVI